MNKIWNETEIRRVLDEIGTKFDFPCNEVPIVISSRMTRCLGSFTSNRKNILSNGVRKAKHTPIKFTFSESLLKGKYGEEQIRQTIIHEYIHFYVTIKFQERHGHDSTFKHYCRVAGISDETKSHTPISEEYMKIADLKTVYVTRCSCCNKITSKHLRKTKAFNNPERFTSHCCHKPIVTSIEKMVI